MICELVHDPVFLAGKSEKADQSDLQTAQDLLDTLLAHQSECVGMAANMIGVRKRIIVFDHEGAYLTMLNPVILKKSGLYETEEGCLSLSGTRKTTRYQTIEVSYLDQSFNPRRQVYTGWIAQVIQHEIDHCDGIII